MTWWRAVPCGPPLRPRPCAMPMWCLPWWASRRRSRSSIWRETVCLRRPSRARCSSTSPRALRRWRAILPVRLRYPTAWHSTARSRVARRVPARARSRPLWAQPSVTSSRCAPFSRRSRAAFAALAARARARRPSLPIRLLWHRAWLAWRTRSRLPSRRGSTSPTCAP